MQPQDINDSQPGGQSAFPRRPFLSEIDVTACQLNDELCRLSLPLTGIDSREWARIVQENPECGALLEYCQNIESLQPIKRFGRYCPYVYQPYWLSGRSAHTQENYELLRQVFGRVADFDALERCESELLSLAREQQLARTIKSRNYLSPSESKSFSRGILAYLASVILMLVVQGFTKSGNLLIDLGALLASAAVAVGFTAYRSPKSIEWQFLVALFCAGNLVSIWFENQIVTQAAAGLATLVMLQAIFCWRVYETSSAVTTADFTPYEPATSGRLSKTLAAVVLAGAAILSGAVILNNMF